MAHLDIHAKAEIGKSLAGFTLGDLALDNTGVLFFEIPNNNGYTIYFLEPKIELGFTEKGTLCDISAGAGYKGDIFEGNIKIGSYIGDIDHALVLDDAEDIYYLADNEGQIIEGMYSVASGLELEEDPDSIIEEVRIYNYNLI